MSMAMSIEARAPFEDHHLIDLAFRIPLSHKLRAGDSKRVLKDAVADLLPPDILQRPKWGFMPPMSGWLRGCLRPLVERYLSYDYVESVGIMQPSWVSSIVDGHLNRNEYHLTPLWTALVLHIWHALYIDQSPHLDEPLSPAMLVRQSP
jgi:asparagine synthase (glutamine-hydrolysing)